jgi:nitrite reductase/ring-hydroxylating ferredoxin subunit
MQPDATSGQSDFIRLVRLDQLPMDRGVFIEAGGKELAVFRTAEPPGVYVIDNSCPHASGNLSAGDIRAGAVRCPWHGWAFRLCDGKSADGGVARVNTYPVEIRGDDVFVKLIPNITFKFEE